MYRLSRSEIISVCLISLNSIAINSIVILKSIGKFNTVLAPSNDYNKSQMEKMLSKSIIKVAIYRGTAYWVLNNVIYKARVDENGKVLNNEAEEVDVFKLSEKEVNNLLTIIDSISS